MSIAVRSLDVSDSLVWLYLGEDRERQRGQIIGSLVKLPRSLPRDHLSTLERATGRTFKAVCAVINVFVYDLNAGLGVALYTALAEVAAERFGAPIVSSSCFGSDISDDAKRTWASRRLAQRIIVRGHCAWGGEA